MFVVSPKGPVVRKPIYTSPRLTELSEVFISLVENVFEGFIKPKIEKNGVKLKGKNLLKKSLMTSSFFCYCEAL